MKAQPLSIAPLLVVCLSACPLLQPREARCGADPDAEALGIDTGVVGRVNGFLQDCPDAEVHVASYDGELTAAGIGGALMGDDAEIVRGEGGPYSVALAPGAWLLCYDDGLDVTCARPVLQEGDVVRVEWSETDLGATMYTEPADMEDQMMRRVDVWGDDA